MVGIRVANRVTGDVLLYLQRMHSDLARSTPEPLAGTEYEVSVAQQSHNPSLCRRDPRRRPHLLTGCDGDDTAREGPGYGGRPRRSWEECQRDWREAKFFSSELLVNL